MGGFATFGGGYSSFSGPRNPGAGLGGFGSAPPSASGEATERRSPTVVAMVPCMFRGEKTAEVLKRGMCGCTEEQRTVWTCSKHGKCLPHSGALLTQIQRCLKCDDRQEAEGPSESGDVSFGS